MPRTAGTSGALGPVRCICSERTPFPVQAMGKKAELEAREVFGNPDNPLNPEVLQQRARELQEGFEEQIKSASGGMLDLGEAPCLDPRCSTEAA